MDFTLKKYGELLYALGKGDFTFKNYLENKSSCILLRHDVDRAPGNALKMARLENSCGVKASYYFRVPFDVQVVERIARRGHEIGYHYECLDKARGDVEKAIKIFEEELKLFRNWNVKTIAMHGNPLSKWNNLDMWNKADFKKYGLIGEAYLSVDFSKINYFTDTGRRWNSERFSVKDKPGVKLISVKNTDELIRKLKSKEIKNAYILTHPNRWNDQLLPWAVELIWQNAKNIGKGLLR